MATVSQTHIFNVEMTCEGCSNAVMRVLGKLKDQGVDDIQIDLPQKKVQVRTSLPSTKILEVLKKTGKNVNYINTI